MIRTYGFNAYFIIFIFRIQKYATVRNVFCLLKQYGYSYAIIMSKKGESMPQIVPIRDLRNTNEISQLCHAKDEPIFVTKNGYGDLVVMSMKTYESLTKISDIDNAISSSEAKIKDEGSLLDAKDALKSLRGKYFE